MDNSLSADEANCKVQIITGTRKREVRAVVLVEFTCIMKK